MPQDSVLIMVGDVLDRLAELPDQSVHCVVTSPPYWGLRDYGIAGQLGLERTPSAHIAAMVAVFREVKRVLRDDGTLWLNYGDCYATSVNGRSAADQKAAGTDDRTFRDKPFGTAVEGLKPKDLVGMPWRIAFALQADGWYLRRDIVWSKPNAMPESITDRPATAHEYVFLFSKKPRYFYDAEAIAEPVTGGAHARAAATWKAPDGWASHEGAHGSFHRDGREKGKKAGANPKAADPNSGVRANADFQASISNGVIAKRNSRSVWSIPTEPFSGAHFATFPQELARRCVLAGCPSDGTVLDPFGGSGTVGLVAAKHGRSAILIELNPEYAALAVSRLKASMVEGVNGPEPTTNNTGLPLFAGGEE